MLAGGEKASGYQENIQYSTGSLSRNVSGNNLFFCDSIPSSLHNKLGRKYKKIMSCGKM